MRLVFFLTFVLVLSAGLTSEAAPDSTLTPNKIDSGPNSAWQAEGEKLIKSRELRPHTFSPSLGALQGPLVDKGEDRYTNYLGLSQTNQNADFTSENFGVELTQLGLVGAFWNWRNLITYGRTWDFFYQIGAGALYKSQESLATFINYERYHLQVGFGFEDLFRRHRAWQGSLEISLSPLGVVYLLQIGYCFPD